jgi:cobalamin biosynthesis protein CobD/CbiB
MQWNMSSCVSAAETWWGGSLLRADAYGLDMLNVTDPVITGRFDNQSATFTISGFFRANTDARQPNSGRSLSALAGRISIEFLGRIDSMRSDPLSIGQDGPEWKPVIGFQGDTIASGDSSRAARRMVWEGGFWSFMIAIVAALCWI